MESYGISALFNREAISFLCNIEPEKLDGIETFEDLRNRYQLLPITKLHKQKLEAVFNLSIRISTEKSSKDAIIKCPQDAADLVNYGDIKICTDTKTYRTTFIPLKDRFLHTLILGPTGSGKTSQFILPMINQDLQNINCGITVIEPKSDLAEKIYAMAQYYGRKCLYFNPQYPSCPSFNPLFGEEEIITENMVLCFRTAMEDSPDIFKDANE